MVQTLPTGSESVIDPNTGNILQIKQFLSEREVSVHDLEYDEYGNLKKIIRPKNAKDQRLSFDYVVHTYTFGQIPSSKDLNGNGITYEPDNLGRVVTITGPYEQGGGNKTIEFEYNPEAIVH